MIDYRDHIDRLALLSGRRWSSPEDFELVVEEFLGGFVESALRHGLHRSFSAKLFPEFRGLESFLFPSVSANSIRYGANGTTNRRSSLRLMVDSESKYRSKGWAQWAPPLPAICSRSGRRVPSRARSPSIHSTSTAVIMSVLITKSCCLAQDNQCVILCLYLAVCINFCYLWDLYVLNGLDDYLIRRV
jgi:hypothetical protein